MEKEAFVRPQSKIALRAIRNIAMKIETHERHFDLHWKGLFYWTINQDILFLWQDIFQLCHGHIIDVSWPEVPSRSTPNGNEKNHQREKKQEVLRVFFLTCCFIRNSITHHSTIVTFFFLPLNHIWLCRICLFIKMLYQMNVCQPINLPHFSKQHCWKCL